MFFCILLYVLQQLINKAVNTPDNKCGCLCLTCCATSPQGVQTCRNATAASPCSALDDCQLYDATRCGFQYSDADQAGYCAVASPSVWPALLQVPPTAFLAEPGAVPATAAMPSGAAAVLMTGGDPALVDQLTLFPQPGLTPGAAAAAQAFAQLGEQSVSAGLDVSRAPRPACRLFCGRCITPARRAAGLLPGPGLTDALPLPLPPWSCRAPSMRGRSRCWASSWAPPKSTQCLGTKSSQPLFPTHPR